MKVLIALLIAFGAYQHFQAESADGAAYGSHDEIIMYALTTCGYCKQKSSELHKEGIEFREIFIDQDPSMQKELNRKLSAAGLPPRGYGVPIMDVHGVMLPNNPSLRKIKKYM